MPNSVNDVQKQDSYLAELKKEGADLLIRRPEEGSLDRARLSLIDAKIEQLTSPITSDHWTESED